MIVVIGDTHIKNSEPHLYGLRKFFEWLLENYKDAHIICLGDFYDQSSPYNPVEDEFIGYIKKFKSFHILEGNHTVSRRSGSGISHLKHHNNIHVYVEDAEVTIDGHSFLMLPWIYNAKEYESILGTYDYILTHVTPPQCAFGDEGVELRATGQYLHGHTHMQLDFVDGFKQSHKVVGIPVVTRNGENQQYRIFTIDDFGMNQVNVPVFFEYEDIEYGKFPENKNNVLNIKKSPSYQSVWEMYKGYHVRKEGIEVLRTENEETKQEVAFELGNIVEKFQAYSVDKKLPKEIHDRGIEYLKEVV